MKREYNFRKGKRGAVVPALKGKTRITIRIDDDILEWFRGEVEAAGGGTYQTLINNALREYITHQPKRPKRKGSPLAVDGIKSKLSRREILESIEEGRRTF
jgi:hypothetical protein